MPEACCQFARLPNFGALLVTGTDAERFLTAQLSQTPPAAGALRAPLAGWHDAKGRVQALFRILRRADGYLLVTHASVVETVAAALRRYVLRADVAIDIDTHSVVAALIGECGTWITDRGIELAVDAGAIAAHDDAVFVRLGASLLHVLAPIETIDNLEAELPHGSAVSAELAEIELGLPAVSAETQGLFLPQMLNLDVLGGVAFDKGCYPGQEIVARAQHLGQVKRRMLRLSMIVDAEPPAAGTTLASSFDQTAGVVVRSARTTHGVELLAVVKLEADMNSLTCEPLDNTFFQHGALPYSLPTK